MQLHHQAIVCAHPRHFHQHVPGETAGIVGCGLTFQGALKNGIRFRRRQPFGERGQGGMIGSGCAH